MKSIVLRHDRRRGTRMIRLVLSCGHEDEVLLPMGASIPTQPWCCDCAWAAKEKAGDVDRKYQESVEV